VEIKTLGDFRHRNGTGTWIVSKEKELYPTLHSKITPKKYLIINSTSILTTNHPQSQKSIFFNHPLFSLKSST